MIFKEDNCNKQITNKLQTKYKKITNKLQINYKQIT